MVDARVVAKDIGARWRRGVALAVASLVLVGLATACEPAPVPVPSPGCSLAATTGVEARTVSGRTYHLVVPAGVTDEEATGVPLLVVLHGLNVDWDSIYNYADFETMAATEGYVVVYPEAVGQTWNASEDGPDVTWLRSVVADVEANQCIDPSHVHAVGHSMGAYMAQRLACDANDVFASVAEYAGGPTTLAAGWGGCTPDRPSSIAMYHGTADPLIPISLGTTSRDQWLGRFGCDTPAAATQVTADGIRAVYAGCDSDVWLSWREFTGQKHLWPASSDIEVDMWSHFMSTRHPTRLVHGT